MEWFLKCVINEKTPLLRPDFGPINGGNSKHLSLTYYSNPNLFFATNNSYCNNPNLRCVNRIYYIINNIVC